MGEEGKKEEDKQERRFSQEQYEMLLRCSDKKDMTEWNEWRRKKDEDIELEEADLHGRYLKGVVLSTDTVLGVHGKVYLCKANFVNTDLMGADLRFAHLECANFNGANLESANFSSAHLEGAYLMDAGLERAKLNMANMEGAVLRSTNMRSANLNSANLRGAEFLLAIVDGSTLIWYCKVDRHTDFRGVGLDSARIDPGTKQLLRYNIRWLNWQNWYKGHLLLRWPVKCLLWISDYGRSTSRIIAVLLGIALVFANVYYWWGLIAPPGIISYLFVDGDGAIIPAWLVFLRAIYFSIVTMTTLGFGDMYANALNMWGHILLTFQVLLGYILFGVLITRVSVIFTTEGPAGKFAEEKKETAQ